MGIVRDITVEELKQAVNNIDTSKLAQDSTLQAVVTAISNISGGSDPVTNTTVNTLGKDTTLQSIAAAISGLGATLGSDKANIDGSNIANPATFRSNIGITLKTVTANIPSTSAGSYSTISVDISSSPANIRLIAGFNIYGSTTLVPIQLYFSGYNTIQVRVLNHASSAQSGNIQLYYI